MASEWERIIGENLDLCQETLPSGDDRAHGTHTTKVDQTEQSLLDIDLCPEAGLPIPKLKLHGDGANDTYKLDYLKLSIQSLEATVQSLRKEQHVQKQDLK